MDIIVVGGGVMGCAAAAALSLLGHKVRLFERHRIGTEFGSSHGASRIIRLSYSDADYIPMARRSFDLWRDLERAAGEELLVTTGGIDVGRMGTASLDRTAAAMDAAGVPYEIWSAGDLRAAYPQFRFPDDHVAIFQAETGVLRADRAVAALAALAVRHGAVLREGVTVERVRPDGEGVEVIAGGLVERADRVILCAGPAMGGFLSALGIDIPLVVSKEQASYLKVGNPDAHLPGRFPICIRHFDHSVLSSIFPIIDAPGIKMMIERKTQVASDRDFAVDPAAEAEVRRDAMALLPGFTGEIVGTETCRYTLTRDGDFLIDRHPRHPQIVLCSPCSGHGFKFAPVIGTYLCDLAEGRPLPLNGEKFSLARPGLQ